MKITNERTRKSQPTGAQSAALNSMVLITLNSPIANRPTAPSAAQRSGSFSVAATDISDARGQITSASIVAISPQTMKNSCASSQSPVFVLVCLGSVGRSAVRALVAAVGVAFKPACDPRSSISSGTLTGCDGVQFKSPGTT